MHRSLLTTVAAVCLCVGATASQVLIQRHVDARLVGKPPAPPDVPSLPAALVEGLLRRRVAADLLFIRSSTYAGDDDFIQERHSRLPGLASLVMELDPTWAEGHFLLGLALSLEEANLPHAVAALALGGERFPTQWRFPFVEGAVAFFDLSQPEAAARAWTRAASIPGGPAFVGRLAQRLATASCEEALATLVSLADTGPPEARYPMRQRARHVEWECEFQSVEVAAERFTTANGHPPKDIDALVQAGLLPGVPQDSYGGTFTVGADGTISSSTPLSRIIVGKRRPRTRPISSDGGASHGAMP